MPTYEYGDMWTAYDTSGLFLITTNSTIKRNGELVMGAGIAAEAARRWPQLPGQLGPLVQSHCRVKGHYALLISKDWPRAKLGLFQVKHHWRDKASVDLIKRSATGLFWWAAGKPEVRIDLNYPGIGNGGLDVELVQRLLVNLPDNVHIWRFEK